MRIALKVVSLLLLQISFYFPPCLSYRSFFSALLCGAVRSGSTSALSSSTAPLIPNASQDTAADSVHLKLNGRSDKETKDLLISTSNFNSSTTVTIDEFVDSKTNATIFAGVEGISFRELSCLSKHLCGENYTEVAGRDSSILIRSRSIDLSSNDSLNEVLSLWKEGKLLMKSRDFPYNVLSSRFDNPKVDKFRHTVDSHLNRMERVADEIWTNPTNDVLDAFLGQIKRTSSGKSLKEEFIFDRNMSSNDTVSLLKSFSLWFKDTFTYYYDNCRHCGNKHGNFHFGLIHPSPEEFDFQARVTEMYECAKCNETSRFPRYNSAIKVLSTRAGRCGEYSILMLRLLDRLGYPTRWIVDWNDHVWNEVKLQDQQWVHLDPCEASVGENLLYEGWGKQCTYIFAYSFVYPFAEDVTAKYTSNFSASLDRRESDGISQIVIDDSIVRAREHLKNVSKL